MLRDSRLGPEQTEARRGGHGHAGVLLPSPAPSLPAGRQGTDPAPAQPSRRLTLRRGSGGAAQTSTAAPGRGSPEPPGAAAPPERTRDRLTRDKTVAPCGGHQLTRQDRADSLV